MNIDDIADKKTGQATPGERFHDNWLADLPTNQWPSYIDESAQLLADGILIGGTDLTTADFGAETGEFYQEGLAETADIDPGTTSLPLGHYSAEDLGAIVWAFNQLREEIRQSDRTNFENPSRAIEAAVNKALVESIADGSFDATDLETIRLPESATVSTLVSEVFCRPRSQAYVDLLVETVKQHRTSSLLEHIDEPRMVTRLWDHQREALDAWFAHDCRGYVDMATATGKTVLGLAAIAHHFGALHPVDRDLEHERLQPAEDRRATVLVVAHRDLILNQWKREFDTHLNIPEQSTTERGEHTAEFEWGTVHFWTPKRLQEGGVPDADLVVLDETHHYLGSSGFGSILDEIDGDLLALSGSLDEANARTLERRGIPQLYEFTLRDGQRAGVIPQCDWDVVFAPYEEQSQLAEVTAKCREGLERYRSGEALPDELRQADGGGFETLSEARSAAQSAAGRELKEENPEFREFASAVMARQLTQYNLSPTVSTIVRLVLDKIDRHKCVVLLETNDEIDRVTSELKAKLGEEAYGDLVTVLDEDSDLSLVEQFDENQEHGAIIGVGRTLGEGVDIETADVCINRGRGRLSRSLIQRMGRVLRNPDGEKHAQFFHVSGVPTIEKATMPEEDGITLLETASQMLSWGTGFNARPVFELDRETPMTEQELVDLEQAGAAAIDEWVPDRYEWPADDDIRRELQDICAAISETDGSALLALERADDDHVAADMGAGQSSPEDRSQTADVDIVAGDENTVALAEWLYEVADDVGDDAVDQFIEASVRDYAREAISLTDPAAVPGRETTVDVELNPALDAVLRVYVGGDGREPAVHEAVAHGIQQECDDLAAVVDGQPNPETVRQRLEQLRGEA